MPTNYTGNPAVFYPTIPLPSDSDLRNSNSMGVALQPIVDDLAYLKAKTVPIGGNVTLTGWVNFLTSYGLNFAAGAVLSIEYGSRFLIGVGGHVQGLDASSWWDGVFPYQAADLRFDATSTFTFAAGFIAKGSIIFDNSAVHTYHANAQVDAGGHWSFMASGEVHFKSGNFARFDPGSEVRFAGVVQVEATANWSFAAGSYFSGQLTFGGNLLVTNMIVFKNGGYGWSTEANVTCQHYGTIENIGSIDCNGGQIKPFAAKLVDPAPTVTPYATAAAIPELVSIVMNSASSAITFPPGTVRQKLVVTVAQSVNAHTASLYFQKTGGYSIVTSLRNDTGYLQWLEVWNDGTDWLIVRQGKVGS